MLEVMLGFWLGPKETCYKDSYLDRYQDRGCVLHAVTFQKTRTEELEMSDEANP